MSLIESVQKDSRRLNSGLWRGELLKSSYKQNLHTNSLKSPKWKKCLLYHKIILLTSSNALLITSNPCKRKTIHTKLHWPLLPPSFLHVHALRRWAVVVFVLHNVFSSLHQNKSITSSVNTTKLV